MKKRLFTIIAAIAACGIVFASCEKKAENVAVSSVTLGEPSLTLAPAATATLSYEVLPAEATNKNVTWESSNNNVATVADGVVTAVGVGETIITVRTEDMNKTATCTVTVAVGVTGIALNPSTLDLYIEDTETLAVEFTPAEATNKNVTWTSSQTAIATVADGVVTAVAPGEAVITATTEDGGKTATCTVTVRQSLPTFEDYFGSYRLTGDVAPNGMFGESTRWSQDHGDDPFSGEDVMIKDASDVNPNILASGNIARLSENAICFICLANPCSLNFSTTIKPELATNCLFPHDSI